MKATYVFVTAAMLLFSCDRGRKTLENVYQAKPALFTGDLKLEDTQDLQIAMIGLSVVSQAYPN